MIIASLIWGACSRVQAGARRGAEQHEIGFSCLTVILVKPGRHGDPGTVSAVEAKTESKSEAENYCFE